MRHPIYLDGFATMPLAPEALEAMLNVWRYPSNAGSPHHLGERAAAMIASGRQEVADLIGALPSEIYFTSGATEANNIAILGIARWAASSRTKRRQIIVSAVEHKAILEPAQSLQGHGFDIVIAPVDGNGVVDLPALSTLVSEETLLVSVMAANNETGALQPVDEISKIGKSVGALVHCDAAQAVGKVPVDVLSLDIDYLSISGHKLYGPSGIGALYVAAGSPRPVALFFGGGQQNGLRPGTEPTALISGFGAAAKLASERFIEDAYHCSDLASQFLLRMSASGLNPVVTTGNRPTVPGSLSIFIENMEADELITTISGKVSISTGSACTYGQVLPSHVLIAMGIDQKRSRNIFRVMCNRYNTQDDVIYAADVIATVAKTLVLPTGRARQ